MKRISRVHTYVYTIEFSQTIIYTKLWILLFNTHFAKNVCNVLFVTFFSTLAVCYNLLMQLEISCSDSSVYFWKSAVSCTSQIKHCTYAIGHEHVVNIQHY